MRDPSIDKDLIDHPSLVVLFPHMQSYCTKGLTKHIEGKDSFTASSIEIYANGVFTRVDELDTALVSLRLACRFVTELRSEPTPSTAIYRYHYENFVLRVIGLVDRAHRLVGASLLLPSEKYEAMGGNTFVQKATKTKHPELYSALGAVAEAVNSYRGPRNELIHSSAYSSPELGVFIGIEQFSVDTGSVDLNELKRDYSSAGAAEIEETIGRLVAALTTLLDELGPAFSTAHEFSISKTN
ncbi:Cthe_2314 family HEPN domain-containing protein [Pseudomonas gregormendelii]